MTESKVVEIYEHEVKSGKAWISYEKKPWAKKPTGDPCPPPEDIPLEGPEWTWECNWKIEKRAGHTDDEGWEFASRTRKFYAGGNRQPKTEPKWSDGARRRLWCRVSMKREVPVTKALELNKVIPRVQQGLTGIHNARMQIEEIVRQAPEQAKNNPQMHQLSSTIQKNVTDLIAGLDQLEKQSKEDPAHQKHLAVIKKLRNDCVREQSALNALASQLGISGGQSPPVSGFHQPGNGTASLSGSFPKRGSREWGGSRAESNKIPPPAHSPPPASDSTGRASLAPADHRPVGERERDAVVSSSKQGNIRGSLSITPNMSCPPAPNLVTSHLDSDDDESTAASSFRTSRMSHKLGGGVGMESWDPNDGVFVDRHQHELMIEQRLKPVDEATVMAEIIEERAIEIQKIHKGIVEVNEMFTDLSKFVKGQQCEIDSIFQNADEAAAKTKEAFEQVVQASQLQKDGNCAIS